MLLEPWTGDRNLVVDFSHAACSVISEDRVLLEPVRVGGQSVRVEMTWNPVSSSLTMKSYQPIRGAVGNGLVGKGRHGLGRGLRTGEALAETTSSVDLSHSNCAIHDAETVFLDYVLVDDSPYWAEMVWDQATYSFLVHARGNAVEKRDIRLYETSGVYRGDWGAELSAPEQRTRANAICRAEKPALYRNAIAFVSIGADDEIAGLADRYDIRKHVPIVGGIYDNVIESEWVALMDGDIDVELVNVKVTEDEWWSGSDPHGHFVGMSGSCAQWTGRGAGGELGTAGKPQTTGIGWMFSSAACSDFKRMLCLAY